MAVNSGNLSFGITIDTNKLRSDIENVKNQFASMSREVEGSGIRITNTWKDVAKGIAAVAGVNIGLQGLRQFGQEVLRMTGLMQGLTLSFETMLGTKEQADKLMMGIKEFALATPYTVEESATTVKQLIAMNAAGDDVLQTFKTLGDVAAGLNVPLQRIAINYGQVAALGRLQQREIRDFAMAGIPINEELAKVLGVTVQEVQKLVFEGKVGFPAVQQAFKNMSGEGGRFADMMIKMNSTVMGQMSRLKDQIQLVFAEIGEANTGIIYNVIGGVAELVKNYEKIGKSLAALIITYGAYRVALALSTTAINSNIVAHYANIAALKLAAIAQRALNSALLANPYAAIGVALIGIVSTMWALSDSTTITERVTKQLNDTLEDLKTSGNELINTIRDETAAWRDREQALIKLQELYPEIFKNMDIMAVKSADQVKLTREMATADYERMLAEEKSMMQQLQNQYVQNRSDFRGTTAQAERWRLNYIAKDLQEEIDARYANIQDLNSKLDAENRRTVELQNKSSVKNKAYWENQKKEAQAAIDAMEITAQGSIEWSRQMALITEADQKLKAWSTPTTATTNKIKLDNDILNQQKKLDDALIKLEQDYQQAVIDSQKDGLDKQIAQIKEANRQKLDEIKKAEEELKVLQGGEITIDQNQKFVSQREAANIIMGFDIQKATEQATGDIRTFYQKYLDMRQEFNDRFSAAMASGATWDNLDIFTGQENEALNELASQWAEKSQEYQDFMRRVAEMAKEEVEAEIEIARNALIQILKDGISSDEIDDYLNMLARLNELSDKVQNTDWTGAATKTQKAWKQTERILDNISNEFNDIGDSIGGVAGEVLKVSGNITTSVTSMINSVKTLSITGVDAIKGLQRASVILSAISAGASILNAIFGGDKQREAERQAEILRQQEGYWESINYQVEENIKLLDELSGHSYWEINLKNIELLTHGAEKAVQSLLGWTDSFDGSVSSLVGVMNKRRGYDTESYKAWIEHLKRNSSDAYRRIKLIEDQAKAMYDAIGSGSRDELMVLKSNADMWSQLSKEQQDYINTALDYYDRIEQMNNEGAFNLLQTNTSDINDTFRQWLKSGQKTADDLGRYFADTMRASLTDSFLDSQAYKDAADNFYAEYKRLADNNGDGVNDLTPEEIEYLKGLWTALTELVQTEANSINAITGVAEEGESRTSASQGFAQASQDSIDAMYGVWVNIENNVHLIRQHLDGNGVQSEIQNAANIIMNNIYTQVLAIKGNTDRLENIENYMRVSMNSIGDGVNELQKLNR